MRQDQEIHADHILDSISPAVFLHCSMKPGWLLFSASPFLRERCIRLPACNTHGGTVDPECMVGREDPWLTNMVPGGRCLHVATGVRSLRHATLEGSRFGNMSSMRVCLQACISWDGSGWGRQKVLKQHWNQGAVLGSSSGWKIWYFSVCRAPSKGALWAVLLLETSLQALPLLCLETGEEKQLAKFKTKSQKAIFKFASKWGFFWLLLIWWWFYFQSAV